MLMIDHYAYHNKLSANHPAEKFIFFALSLLLCLALPSTATSLAVLLAMAGTALVVAGIPWRFYFKLMLLPLLFLTAGVLAVAFSVSGNVQGFVCSIQIGALFIGITSDNLSLAANLFLRSMAAVSCLYFLALTTPITDIVSLLNKLRFPSLLIELMVLIYRFIFILLEVTAKIVTSQLSRAGYANWRRSFYAIGELGFSLFTRSYHKSQSMFDALSARCYTGKFHFLAEPRQLDWSNLLTIIGVEAVLLTWSLYAGGCWL